MKPLIIFLLLGLPLHVHAQVTITYDTTSAPIVYATNKLEAALSKYGQSLRTNPIQENTQLVDISILLPENIPFLHSTLVDEDGFQGIRTEGFSYKHINQGKNLLILATEAIGAMYGVLELIELIQLNGMYNIPVEKLVNPSLEYRIIKFNLPWSPYRESAATQIHMETCRDLKFWERFLDMMAENRFNVLSLWNTHPFPYMIRPSNFPKATPFSDQELAEWRMFWKSLFCLAKERGIQTFMVNWNIVVSPEFAAAYKTKEYNDLSDQVKQYTQESVTQIINEYEDLTGIGVTLADWMGNFDAVEMDPQKREDWIEDTFVAGIRNANRPVKFLHRSVLAGDPMAMRGVIDRANLPDPALVEIKFNWSHGHSTPNLSITHDYHTGELDDRFWTPTPTNYKIQWMVRNEDFFILRWGDPDFIRQHINTNYHDYVNGYFIGSEGYIPAVDYSHKASPAKSWQYAFEKQWLFYKTWGRLLYDRKTPDQVFETAFDTRYGKDLGAPLLAAYKLASKMPLRLASFHRSTWDYTLYSEGFCAPEPSSPDGYFDRSSPFISIDELIHHETLDTQWLSIPDFVEYLLLKKDPPPDKITPLQLANRSEEDSRDALDIVNSLSPSSDSNLSGLISELDDIQTWIYLGIYFADKIKAGIALELFRKSGDTSQKLKAIELLQNCITHWDRVVAFTKDRYKPTPHVSTQHYGKEYQAFSWESLTPQVLKDLEIVKTATFGK